MLFVRCQRETEAADCFLYPPAQQKTTQSTHTHNLISWILHLYDLATSRRCSPTTTIGSFSNTALPHLQPRAAATSPTHHLRSYPTTPVHHHALTWRQAPDRSAGANSPNTAALPTSVLCRRCYRLSSGLPATTRGHKAIMPRIQYRVVYNELSLFGHDRRLDRKDRR